MAFQLGDQFLNFSADTTIGKIDFHLWDGDSWVIMFSLSADFISVCTTELSAAARLVPEFTKAQCQTSCPVLRLGRVPLTDKFCYPIIDDENRSLAVKLYMLDKDEIGYAGLPLTCRAVFVIDPRSTRRRSCACHCYIQPPPDATLPRFCVSSIRCR